MDEREREVEAALHAARVAVHLAVGGLGQADALEQLVGARLARSSRGSACSAAWSRRCSRPVSSGSSAASWSAAPIARAHLRALLDDVVAGDARRAGGRRQQRRQHVHGRRLAGAVRAEEAVDLAGRDGQVDPVDGATFLNSRTSPSASMPFCPRLPITPTLATGAYCSAVRRLCRARLRRVLAAGCGGETTTVTVTTTQTVTRTRDDDGTPAVRVYFLRDGRSGRSREQVTRPSPRALLAALDEGPTDAETRARVRARRGRRADGGDRLHALAVRPREAGRSTGSSTRARTSRSLTPAILVETPLPFEAVTAPLRVAGTANTFEATFEYDLLDPAGKVLSHDFVTATSGSGTRGTFDFDDPVRGAERRRRSWSSTSARPRTARRRTWSRSR